MIDFDLREFERAARRVDAYADQVPFALAQALNDAAEIARKEIIDKTWPEHMRVRNARFMAAALTSKGERATKRRLQVAVYDKLGRASLTLHEQGGTKSPRGSAIAVPSAELQGRRSGKGVPKGLRPAALANSFRRGDAVFQRTGKGKSKGLKLMYVLKPSTSIPARVPFHADFERVMRREVHRSFGPRLAAAMTTRRK